MTTYLQQIPALLAAQPGGFFHRQLWTVSALDPTLYRTAYGPIN
jgi:hypothetical protein